MEFHVDRDALAEAVAWTARSLPARPAVPVLGGLLLTATDDGALNVSGFDYEVSTQVELEATVTTAGQTLVSGRLLADITRALPPQAVQVSVQGPTVNIVCGSARFTLPTMPVEDYPALPVMPTSVGTVASDVFSAAVAQVVIAAGKDDTLPTLTGVRLEIENDRITLAATDRYRLAVRELDFQPHETEISQAVLIPAKTLAEAGKMLTNGPEVTLALANSKAGEGIIGFSGASRHATTRLLDAEFPRYRSLWPAEFSGFAEITMAPFVEAIKRVSLVAERGTPVGLEFADDHVRLSAGGDNAGKAEESLPIHLESEPITIAFNPTFLLDGLNALDSDTARLSFTTANKPAVLTGKVADEAADSEFRYLIMPVRLPN